MECQLQCSFNFVKREKKSFRNSVNTFSVIYFLGSLLGLFGLAHCIHNVQYELSQISINSGITKLEYSTVAKVAVADKDQFYNGPEVWTSVPTVREYTFTDTDSFSASAIDLITLPLASSLSSVTAVLLNDANQQFRLVPVSLSLSTNQVTEGSYLDFVQPFYDPNDPNSRYVELKVIKEVANSNSFYVGGSYGVFQKYEFSSMSIMNVGSPTELNSVSPFQIHEEIKVIATSSSHAFMGGTFDAVYQVDISNDDVVKLSAPSSISMTNAIAVSPDNKLYSIHGTNQISVLNLGDSSHQMQSLSVTFSSSPTTPLLVTPNSEFFISLTDVGKLCVCRTSNFECLNNVYNKDMAGLSDFVSGRKMETGSGAFGGFYFPVKTSSKNAWIKFKEVSCDVLHCISCPTVSTTCEECAPDTAISLGTCKIYGKGNHIGFGLDLTKAIKTLEPCTVANCFDCFSDYLKCDQCNPGKAVLAGTCEDYGAGKSVGYGLDPSKTAPTLLACTVTDCEECYSNYQQCNKCNSGKGFHSGSCKPYGPGVNVGLGVDLLSPIPVLKACTVQDCSECYTNYQECDKCKPGFTKLSSSSCGSDVVQPNPSPNPGSEQNLTSPVTTEMKIIESNFNDKAGEAVLSFEDPVQAPIDISRLSVFVVNKKTKVLYTCTYLTCPLVYDEKTVRIAVRLESEVYDGKMVIADRSNREQIQKTIKELTEEYDIQQLQDRRRRLLQADQYVPENFEWWNRPQANRLRIWNKAFTMCFEKFPVVMDGISTVDKSTIRYKMVMGISETSSRIIQGSRTTLAFILAFGHTEASKMLDELVSDFLFIRLIPGPYLYYPDLVIRSISGASLLPFEIPNPFEESTSHDDHCSLPDKYVEYEVGCNFLNDSGSGIIILSVLLLINLLVTLITKLVFFIKRKRQQKREKSQDEETRETRGETQIDTLQGLKHDSSQDSPDAFKLEAQLQRDEENIDLPEEEENEQNEERRSPDSDSNKVVAPLENIEFPQTQQRPTADTLMEENAPSPESGFSTPRKQSSEKPKEKDPFQEDSDNPQTEGPKRKPLSIILKSVFHKIGKSYGLRFFLTKLDGMSLEILCSAVVNADRFGSIDNNAAKYGMFVAWIFVVYYIVYVALLFKVANSIKKEVQIYWASQKPLSNPFEESSDTSESQIQEVPALENPEGAPENNQETKAKEETKSENNKKIKPKELSEVVNIDKLNLWMAAATFEEFRLTEDTWPLYLPMIAQLRNIIIAFALFLLGYGQNLHFMMALMLPAHTVYGFLMMKASVRLSNYENLKENVDNVMMFLYLLMKTASIADTEENFRQNIYGMFMAFLLVIIVINNMVMVFFTVFNVIRELIIFIIEYKRSRKKHNKVGVKSTSQKHPNPKEMPGSKKTQQILFKPAGKYSKFKKPPKVSHFPDNLENPQKLISEPTKETSNLAEVKKHFSPQKKRPSQDPLDSELEPEAEANFETIFQPALSYKQESAENENSPPVSDLRRDFLLSPEQGRVFPKLSLKKTPQKSGSQVNLENEHCSKGNNSQNSLFEMPKSAERS